MKKFAFLFFLLLLILSVNAQDTHFSQFYWSYSNLNPALTGQFNGNYRLNSNYKSQWSSVSEPFNTISFSAEGKRLIKNYAPLNFGISILSDQAGLGDLQTNQFNLSVARNWKLNADSSFSLGSGLQIGYTNRSINFNNFTFDQQYNGNRFVESRSNGENFATNSFGFLNLNLGMAFHYQFERRKKYSLGISTYNLSRPNQSFLNSNIPLKVRSQFYINAQHQISEKIDAEPAIYYSTQGPNRELFLGSNFKYYFSESSSMKRNLYLGFWYRNKDALVPLLGVEYDAWRVAVNYDINISDLEVASNNRGGIEFSLTYIINTFKPKNIKFKRCPKFI